MFTACNTAYAAAFDLAEEGITVPVIIDHRTDIDDDLRKQAGELGIRVITGAAITATGGRLRVNRISWAKHDGSGAESADVDTLITSAGWTPSLHLYSQSRGKPHWDDDRQRFIPG